MRPSILDRLLPPEARKLNLRARLVADIETLLNTRNHHAQEWAESHPNAADSMLAFGVGGVDDCLLTSQGDVTRLRTEIEGALRRFEPRLSHVSVTTVGEAPRKYTNEVMFEIRVTLRDSGEEFTLNSLLHDCVLSVSSES